MSIQKSRYPDPDIPEIPFQDVVLSVIKNFGDMPAIVNGVTGKEYTYSQLCDFIHRIASGLARSGIKKGDVVCICLQNCPEFIFTQFGVLSAGAVLTTVNPLYTAEEMHAHFLHSSTKVVVTQVSCAGRVKQAATSCNQIQAIYVIDGEVPGCLPFSLLKDDDGSAFPSITYNPREDIAYLPYSSGTTGLPKGVMLTHHNLVSIVAMLATMKPVDFEMEVPDHQPSAIAIIPMFHMYGLHMINGLGLIRGLKIITLPKFQPDSYLRTIEKYRVEDLLIVPPLVLFMVNDPRAKKYDLSCVKRVSSGAAPLSKAMNEKCAKEFNLTFYNRVTNGYGLTETSGAAMTSHTLKKITADSIGLLLPGSEGKVVDPETGRILGPNKDGEVCLRGPHVMKGYLNDPSNTELCIRDGWFHTGDIGHYSEEGYWFIVDRIKELIKCKGFQVAPAELEHLLMTHPSVRDAAVIGFPDEKAGELPMGFVVLKEGQSATAPDIKEHVAKHVAPYKKLCAVEFTSTIPRNASGKIIRRHIKKKAVETYKSKL